MAFVNSRLADAMLLAAGPEGIGRSQTCTAAIGSCCTSSVQTISSTHLRCRLFSLLSYECSGPDPLLNLKGAWKCCRAAAAAAGFTMRAGLDAAAEIPGTLPKVDRALWSTAAGFNAEGGMDRAGAGGTVGAKDAADKKNPADTRPSYV